MKKNNLNRGRVSFQIEFLKYSLFCFLFFFVFLACEKEQESQEYESSSMEENIPIEPQKPYVDFLEENDFQSLNKQERKARFFDFIEEDVPNYWVGTKWDFNGSTRIPKQGEIACGYFVTNVLTDFGFPIRRIYLAQQASSVMIEQLCKPSTIKKFTNFNQLTHYLKTQSDNEVFIVGLDFHTGFIIKKGDALYFLHSNYIQREGVVKESLEESKAIEASNFFMVGSLSQNDALFSN